MNRRSSVPNNVTSNAPNRMMAMQVQLKGLISQPIQDERAQLRKLKAVDMI